MAITPGCFFIAHMKDGPMIRIRLPGGRISAGQLRAIAELAERRGNGLIDLTNRGNLQVRGLNEITLSALRSALGPAGLLPANPKADRIRNIVADPLAGLDAGEIVDTMPIVAALDRLIQTTRPLRRLVPEFEFVVDNGGRSGVGGLPHDIGLIAEKNGRTPRFRLSIAGIMTRLTATPDRSAELAIAAARAALLLSVERELPALKQLARYGWRAGSCQATGAALVRAALSLAGPFENRFRRLVKTVPIDKIVAGIAEFATPDIAASPADNPARRTLSPAVGAIEQRRRGTVSCGLGVSVGRLDTSAAVALAGLGERFGDGSLRLAPWHAVFVPDVDAERADSLLRRARELGFATDPSFVRIRMFACSGVTGCRGGKLDTKQNARATFAAIETALAGRAEMPERPLTVHLSGCIKGCAHRQKSDVFALERSDGYDIYENCGPGVPPPDHRHRGTVTETELPASACGSVAPIATPAPNPEAYRHRSGSRGNGHRGD